MHSAISHQQKGVYNCQVLFNKNLSDEIYLMRLYCPEIADCSVPGQFVNVKVNREFIPLLRKPFSICRRNSREGWFDILWKVVGKGTSVLSGSQKGDFVSVIGPLGHGYNIVPDLRKALLVAGGLGVAPFPFLCDELLKAGKSIRVFIGTRHQKELALVENLQSLPIELQITTEDGSAGSQGLVTDALIQYLSELDDLSHTLIFSCGPIGLLKRICEISDDYNIGSQVALETMMACGFGICMGCPVRLRHPQPNSSQVYKLTCIDGPVFDAKEILVNG